MSRQTSASIFHASIIPQSSDVVKHKRRARVKKYFIHLLDFLILGQDCFSLSSSSAVCFLSCADSLLLDTPGSIRGL